MIAISVNSSASVLVSVISSIKQELRFINPLRQLNMFVKNLQSDVCVKHEVVFTLCLSSLYIGHSAMK